ncbi:MAG: hypothetical protein Q4D38_07465 [Planctomycetia bacterium]|nr:hypothetical protein [Planctomycetia bacterium]
MKAISIRMDTKIATFFTLLLFSAFLPLFSEELAQIKGSAGVAQYDGTCLRFGDASEESEEAVVVFPTHSDGAAPNVRVEDECIVIDCGKIIYHVWALPDSKFWAIRPSFRLENGSGEKTILLPEIQLSERYNPARHVVLGTFIGLKEVDDHSGSYTWLAIANPETKKGLVAAWLTSNRASGVVFSDKSKDGEGIVVRAESQYGIPISRAFPLDSDECDGEIFVFGFFDDCRIGLEEYAQSVATHYKIRLPRQLSGYCTWYSDKFGRAGSEESTLVFAQEAGSKLVPFGMDFFQIDDHWQSGAKGNGPTKNFTTHNPLGPYPAGMALTSQRLERAGLRAGIWMIPFAGNCFDPLFENRQHWFVQSSIDYPPKGKKSERRFSKITLERGKPYSAHWGGTCLDFSQPEAAQFLHDEIDQIANGWGYRYFKFDGLWTGLACEMMYRSYDYIPDDFGNQTFCGPHWTNVDNYRRGLAICREAAGEDAFFLGCNLCQNMRVLGASFGLVDAMRVGPDNGTNWKAMRKGPTSGTSMYFLNRRVWFNDPDPVYVRDAVPLPQARALCSWVALSGQLFAFSDWLPDLSEERVDLLRRTMAPHSSKNARPIDLFQTRLANFWILSDSPDAVVLGIFNWEEHKNLAVDRGASTLDLENDCEYVGFDYWANEFVPPFKNRLKCELPPASCRILSLRKWEETPILVSTSRHVASPIFEVEEEHWDTERKTYSGRSRVVANDPYELRFVVPKGMKLREKKAVVAQNADDIQVSAEGQFVRVRFLPRATGATQWSVRFEENETQEGE